MKILANNLKRFKVITFDCTNTMLYFKQPPDVKYLDTAEKFGLSRENFDKNLMKVNFRKQFKEMNEKFPNFGRDSIFYQSWWTQLVVNILKDSRARAVSFDEKTLTSIAGKLIEEFKTDECWGKFGKTDELINSMKSAGKTVGVISNYDPRLHDLLRNMKMPVFDFVLTSYESGFEKPSPEIFLEAIKGRCEPSEALHIGNELVRDYQGARSAGLSSILINSNCENDVKMKFDTIEDFWNVITSEKVEIQ